VICEGDAGEMSDLKGPSVLRGSGTVFVQSADVVRARLHQASHRRLLACSLFFLSLVALLETC
jgi:hypothetical protein